MQYKCLQSFLSKFGIITKTFNLEKFVTAVLFARKLRNTNLLRALNNRPQSWWQKVFQHRKSLYNSSKAELLCYRVLEEPNDIVKNLGVKLHVYTVNANSHCPSHCWKEANRHFQHSLLQQILKSRHLQSRRSVQTPQPTRGSCKAVPACQLVSRQPSALSPPRQTCCFSLLCLAMSCLHPRSKSHKDLAIQQEA